MDKPRNNLIQTRQLREWSQEKLAEKAGIKRLTYINIERGRSEPKLETIYKILEALDVPDSEVFWLFEESEEE